VSTVWDHLPGFFHIVFYLNAVSAVFWGQFQALRTMVQANPQILQVCKPDPWFLIHLCRISAIVPQILSLLRDAELSHADMIIFSPLATNKMTPQLWVALWMFGEWITKANASGVGEAKSCLVAAYQ
jgi:hypothetical protein